jgi:PKD repeat protein
MKKLMLVVGLFFIASICIAANNVEIHFNYPRDTIYMGHTNRVEYWIENDDTIRGLALGMEYDLSDETLYDSISVIWDSLYGNNPPMYIERGVGQNSMVYLFDSYFDFSHIFLPDSLCTGGYYMPPIFKYGISPGVLRHAYTLQFDISTTSGNEDLGYLCADNIFVYPACDWIFDDGIGSFPPDYFGCVNSSSSYPDCPAVCYPIVDVNVRPLANFAFSPDSGLGPLNVQFTDRSLFEPTSWLWVFGDGDSSTEQNPEHIYTFPGIYAPKLIVENAYGIDSMIATFTYIVIVSEEPEANFTFYPGCGFSPLGVQFTDLSLNDPTEWVWQFGDGDYSYEQNPYHNYSGIGQYYPSLIATNSYGSDTVVSSIPIYVLNDMQLDFWAYPTRARIHSWIAFQSDIYPPPDSVRWDFGDGNFSYRDNPSNYYHDAGLYDIKLAAKLCGQWDSIIKTDYILISDLWPYFSTSSRNATTYSNINFYDLSEGSPTSWLWRFGDGESSVEQYPQHAYGEPGDYDIFLRVSDDLGYTDSIMMYNYISIYDVALPDLWAIVYDVGAKPGFDYFFWCKYGNKGLEPAQNCTLMVVPPEQIIFSDVYVEYIHSATYGGYSQNGDTIIIPLGTINVSGYNIADGQFKFLGHLPDTIPIGDTLVIKCWITSSDDDLDPTNNGSGGGPGGGAGYPFPVTGSIDPNDKIATPGGKEPWYEIDPDQRLYYTVQFENKPEATAEATYILVVDTLDPDLDWGSLAFGAMSHPEPCSYELDPFGGIITWFCDSIMLPPNVNPPEGEGYFTYSIMPKSDLEQGTEIENSAWIRFDYNAWLMAPEAGPIVRVIKFPFICGDANGDEIVNVSDAVYIINYVFVGGDPPDPIESGDANCDGVCNVSDAVWIINYVFVGGNEPCDTSGDCVPDC